MWFFSQLLPSVICLQTVFFIVVYCSVTLATACVACTKYSADGISCMHHVAYDALGESHYG